MARRVLEGHEGPVKCLAMSGDGKIIATCSDDKTIKVWHADTGCHPAELAHTLSVPDSCSMCMDLSKDGGTLVSQARDNGINVWRLSDEQTPTLLHTMLGHSDAMTALKFSPDGQKIASASADTTVIIWSVHTGVKLLTFTGHKAAVSCLATSLLPARKKTPMMMVVHSLIGKPMMMVVHQGHLYGMLPMGRKR